jgi:hypothetical protein
VQTLKVEVTVSKEAYELGQGIAKFHEAIKQALADGWQSGQDIPPIISSAVADLVPAVQGADQVSKETDDKQAFANAIYLGLSPVAFAYIK